MTPDGLTPTPLRVRFVSGVGVGNRWTWRLETARGAHFCVVESGTAYLTFDASRQGWRRFARWYLKADAPISEVR